MEEHLSPDATRKLTVLPGDGVGPEVTDAALAVLEAVGARFGTGFETSSHPVGWTAVQATGSPLPEGTLEASRSADAVFLGAVGHPDADGEPPERRPEAGLLKLRRELGCYANLRPARIYAALEDQSPVAHERVKGTDLLLVRELAGGLYYGEPRGWDRAEGRAVNTLVYTRPEIERIARTAFELARGRRRHVVSVDKANVLDVSRLWRQVVTEVAADYPDVRLDHMLVDRAAMELVIRPAAWDVWLTSNLFGDILSDEAGAVVGSLGLLGSASLGDGVGLYEPVHGSAPDIAGQDKANPVGAIASMAMMLRHSFGLAQEAAVVEDALETVLASGLRTADIVGSGGAEATGTRAFAAAVADVVRG